MAVPSNVADEVATDFKESLQDLQVNNRFEISNLTIIAKENIEHASAISRVLEHHIKTTTQDRKLPALYVLDSIVKNVGTPYNIYLGRNLFDTFMGAYTLVDAQTRKNMESMLKTWKESVPGSMESRPVFPVDTTRNIENALIKARTAFVQQQQARTQGQVHALPPRPTIPAGNQYINTPTPPQNDPRFTRPPSSSGGMPFTFQDQQYPQAQAQFSQLPFYQGSGHTQQSHNADTLHEDLQRLVISARNEFASNPYDPSIQSKLKALLDLQTILQTQHLPPDQRQLIKNQVARLSSSSSEPQKHLQAPPSMLPVSQYQQPTLPSSIPQRYPSPVVQQPPAVSTTDLAKLLGSSAPGRQPTPPVVQPSAPPPPSLDSLASLLGAAQPQSNSSNQPPVAPSSSLIDQLRGAGMINQTGPPSRPSSAIHNQPGFLAPPMPGQSVATPPIPSATLSRATLSRTPLAEIQNDIQLTMSSLRKPRPQLANALFKPLPSQCNTCGRRFPATAAGKARKDRHLDFHFRSNQRLAEAVRRTGISRSWFVDEMEWIRFRETVDGDDENGSGETDESGSAEKGTAEGNTKASNKAKFVKAPSDAAMSSRTCPICQEKFETVWHDGAQEWVWMDAEVANGRVYHASCRSEVMKDGADSKHVNLSMRRSVTPSIPPRGGSNTPESVLGKRKAEGDAVGNDRLKREMAA